MDRISFLKIMDLRKELQENFNILRLATSSGTITEEEFHSFVVDAKAICKIGMEMERLTLQKKHETEMDYEALDTFFLDPTGIVVCCLRFLNT